LSGDLKVINYMSLDGIDFWGAAAYQNFLYSINQRYLLTQINPDESTPISNIIAPSKNISSIRIINGMLYFSDTRKKCIAFAPLADVLNNRVNRK
jgi:hypothetical protein